MILKEKKMTHYNRPGPRTNQENEIVNKQLLVLMTENKYEKLQELSESTKRSKSDLVREALDNYFKFNE